MKTLLLLILIPSIAFSIPPKKIDALKEIDSFYDEDFDYSRFPARITDRDKANNMFKVETENNNIKFFRAGDQLQFKIAGQNYDFCSGHIRTIEGNHFVMYVKDLDPCWRNQTYFRRGTLINVFSEKLAQRVRDASVYRVVLLNRKRDFYEQLNDINHFIWSYEQKRIQLVAEYDRRIAEIERNKQKALSKFITKKRDNIHLQKELVFRLDSLDRDLEYYRIEKNDYITDRWAQDLDLGLPVGRRPQRLKSKSVRN